MYTQCLLVIALAAGTLSFAKVNANLEPFPVVTYEDIELSNATCPGIDNCALERSHDNLHDFNCNCDEFCTQYDTCCVDSKYRDKERKIRKQYNCVQLLGYPRQAKLLKHRPVYMVDSCDTTWSGDNYTEELCTAKAQDNNDLFLAIPVTSHKTRITYKNYYCAICNNETDKDQLTMWNISLESSSKEAEKWPLTDIHFVHKKSFNSEGFWYIGNDTHGTDIAPVVKIPDEIKEMVHDCQYNVISRCASDWNDTVIENKCAAYMAITRTDWRTYRNPHCAICNHKSLDLFSCSDLAKLLNLSRKPSNTFFVRLFSMYDKESKCGDSQVYDTLAKKCRKVYKG